MRLIVGYQTFKPRTTHDIKISTTAAVGTYVEAYASMYLWDSPVRVLIRLVAVIYSIVAHVIVCSSIIDISVVHLHILSCVYMCYSITDTERDSKQS